MKQSPTKAPKTLRERSAKSQGVSVSPPQYGIDFADSHATGQGPLQKPGKCGCQGKKKRLGSSRCACSGPKKRPPAGSFAGLDEESGARAPSPSMGREKTRPQAGSATIVCDGNGGYRVDLGGWAGAPCGIEACVTRHEESHIADWEGRWPNGCKNADGSNKPDGGAIPLGGAGYAAFLKQSECDAYTVEEGCISPLVAGASGACKTTLEAHLADTQNQKTSYCS